MPWIKREDGFDAALNAHHALDQIIRDRAIPPADATTVMAFAEELLPGDTEIDEAEYDAFHGVMTVQNYEQVFVPHKESRLARLRQAQLDHTQQLDSLLMALGADLATVTDDHRRTLEGDAHRQYREALENAISQLEVTITDDRAELGAVEADLVAKRTVRARRNGS